MMERQKQRSLEIPQWKIYTHGLNLITALFINCESYQEYKDATPLISQDGRKNIMFYLGNIRYLVSFSPDVLKNVSSTKKVVLKKRRGDSEVEDRLTIELNRKNAKKPHRIKYERFILRKKDPTKVYINDREAISQGERIVRVRRPLDLSTE